MGLQLKSICLFYYFNCSTFIRNFLKLKFFQLLILVTCGNYKFRIVTSILQSTFILSFAIAKETFGISRAGSRNLLKKFSSLKKKKNFWSFHHKVYIIILKRQGNLNFDLFKEIRRKIFSNIISFGEILVHFLDLTETE